MLRCSFGVYHCGRESCSWQCRNLEDRTSRTSYEVSSCCHILLLHELRDIKAYFAQISSPSLHRQCNDRHHVHRHARPVRRLQLQLPTSSTNSSCLRLQLTRLPVPSSSAGSSFKFSWFLLQLQLPAPSTNPVAYATKVHIPTCCRESNSPVNSTSDYPTEAAIDTGG